MRVAREDVDGVATGGLFVGGAVAVVAGLVCLSFLSIMADQWMKRALFESGTVPYLYKREVILLIKRAAAITGYIAVAGVGLAAISGAVKFGVSR